MDSETHKSNLKRERNNDLQISKGKENIKELQTKIGSVINRKIEKVDFPELSKQHLIGNKDSPLKLNGELRHKNYIFMNNPMESIGIPLTESMDIKLATSSLELIKYESNIMDRDGGLSINMIMRFRGLKDINAFTKKPNYLYISIAVSNKMSSAEILSLFKSKVSRHYDTVNYIVFLDEIDVYNNELSTKGGCNKREHHKRIFRDTKLFFECNGDDVNDINLPKDMRTFTLINPVSKIITV